MSYDNSFMSVEVVTKEGVYDVSDTGFLSEWWPDCKVYLRDGKLRMKHPERGLEITLSGIKGWWFRRKPWGITGSSGRQSKR